MDRSRYEYIKKLRNLVSSEASPTDDEELGGVRKTGWTALTQWRTGDQIPLRPIGARPQMNYIGIRCNAFVVRFSVVLAIYASQVAITFAYRSGVVSSTY